MFQLKNFVSIAASMLNYVRSTTGKVTDLQPGSVTRTILEAPAAEIEELYVQMFNGIKDAIPVAVFNSFEFDRLPPQYASGTVTVIALAPLTANMNIPQGTRFLARDGRIYESIGALTWVLGTPSINVPVRAILPGIAMNAAADEITSSPAFTPDRFSFTSSDITDGADMETDDARMLRFADYVASLSRGTETALLYAARNANLKDAAGNIIESVSRVSLTVNSGSVTVNIWGSNGTPSAALLARVTEIEQGYKDASGNIVPGYSAAGISCAVAAMYQEIVNAVLTVTYFPGFSASMAMRQNIRNTIATYLSNVQPGTFVYADDLQAAIQSVRGVQSASVKMSGNIECQTNEVLSMGAISFMNIVKADFALTLTTGTVITPAMQDTLRLGFNTWIGSLDKTRDVSAAALLSTFMDSQGKPTIAGLDKIAVTLNDEFLMSDDDLVSAGMVTFERQE